MPSKFDICSRSLVELGEDTINSFTANTDPSKICGLIYPEYIRYLLSIHCWKFTLKKVQLARLVDEPLNKWKYKYQLPSDILVLKAFYDSDQEGARAITRYEKFGDNIIQTDEEEVFIDYQIEIAAEDFPPYFVEFVVMALAAKLAMPITDDRGIEEIKTARAFGLPSDNRNGGEFGIAKKIDSLQNPSPAIAADDLVIARFS